MNRVSQSVMKAWIGLGSRFLPFADAATPDVPLSRLLRLSLFQVSVGMSLVLLVGTLNRVMIVELGVPASLVAVMLALPLVFAPFRALIGFKSDNHYSALGWKRVPFVYKGTMVQFGGLAIMPFALLVLARQGNAADVPEWVGQVAAGIAFLLVGAGIHITQTAGLALATDLTPVENQPKVVGLMYVMLLMGSIVSALIFGALLADFTPGRLVQVIQGSAVVTLVLNGIAVWKQEARSRANKRLGQSTRSELPGILGLFHRGRPRRAAPCGRGTRHAGLQHAGRDAGALWRTDSRPRGERHDQADRRDGWRRPRRVQPGLLHSGTRLRSVPHGLLWRHGRHSGLPAGDGGGTAGLRRCSLASGSC